MHARGQGLAVMDAKADPVAIKYLQQVGKEIIFAYKWREGFSLAPVFNSDGLHLDLGQLRRLEQFGMETQDTFPSSCGAFGKQHDLPALAQLPSHLFGDTASLFRIAPTHE